MSKTFIIGGVKRKIILIVLLLVAPHSFAFALDDLGQGAIDAFLKTQNDKADPVLNAQISELMEAGYKKRDSTGAVFWDGGCGVVGCYSTYLVTTVYSTLGANTRSRIVAGIITKTPGKGFRVSRILTKAGIECLFNPK
jgi:hypothetical protein